MKNNNWIWIIVILASFLIVPNFMKKEQVNISFDSLYLCEYSNNQMDKPPHNFKCITPCRLFTQELLDCMNNRGVYYYKGDIGKYAFFQDLTHTCSEINIMASNIQEKVEYDCFTETSTTCIPRHHAECYNGDVYWYDSCNIRGDITFQCGNLECNNGECITPGTCTDTCTLTFEKVCAGNGYRICGNYDADTCLEYSEIISCGNSQTCSNGACIPVINPPPEECGNGVCESKETIISCPQDCSTTTTCPSGQIKCSDNVCRESCSTDNKDTCKFYEEPKDGECKVSMIVWVFAGLFGFMMLMMIMRKKR